jgi:hypothetical protein
LKDLRMLLCKANYQVCVDGIPVQLVVQLIQQSKHKQIKQAGLNLMLVLNKLFIKHIYPASEDPSPELNVRTRFYTICEAAIYDGNTTVSLLAAENLNLLALEHQRAHLVSSLCVLLLQAILESDASQRVSCFHP